MRRCSDTSGAHLKRAMYEGRQGAKAPEGGERCGHTERQGQGAGSHASAAPSGGTPRRCRDNLPVCAVRMLGREGSRRRAPCGRGEREARPGGRPGADGVTRCANMRDPLSYGQ